MRFRIPVMAAAIAFAAAVPCLAQGLEVASGAPVRIETVRIEAAVEEGVATVEVDETFRNTTDGVREGVYRFKLPEDAVIGSFSMWMDGKEKHGRVLEAKTARAVYDSIVHRRKDPGLLEQTGWREFRVNVFPIPARDTVRVRLTYAHVVRDELGLETLEIPLPVGAGAIGDLRVHATVRASRGLQGVDCPSNADAKILSDGNGCDVTWGGDGIVPAKPFVVRAIPKRDGFDVSLLASRPAGAAEGWFVARVVPRLAEPPKIARDVVFVVDRSGSMNGVKMDQARAALLRGIDSLKPGDRFGVVSFASDVTPLAAALLPATAENLDAARRAARELSASGGTNIAAALTSAVALRSGDAARLFAVVFLTDGDASVGETDPDRILAAWRETSGGTRLYALGVGADVKDFLLTKLAVAGRGDAQYVRDEGDLEVKLSALFDRVRTPLLLDPTVDADGAGVEILDREPRRLPDLFQGRALVVTGRYKGAGKATLHLRGRSGADEVKIDVPVEFPAETPARPHLAQIWAKARVERLLDDLRAVGGGDEIKKEILALGLAHRLVTPYTSFLVVEDGVKVPGTDEASAPGAAPADTGEAAVVPGSQNGPASSASGGTARPGVNGRGSGGLGQGGGGGAGGATKATESSVMWGLRWLRDHQSPDGRWDCDGFEAQCKLNKCGGAGGADGDIGATGLALLSFLGAGETHQSGSCRENVKNGLKFLRDVQDSEGAFGPRTTPHFLRDHAIAASAMSEAYGMTGSRIFKEPAERAIAFALKTQSPGGAWMRPAPNDAEVDVETTAWMVMALKSARMSELISDDTAMKAAVAALDKLTDRATGRVAGDDAATAMTLIARIFAGRTPQDDEMIEKGAGLLDACAPKWDAATGAVDWPLWYFGTMAMFQVGGEHWRAWNQAMKTALIDHERMEAGRDERGSWDPAGAADGGRVVSTALGCLQMEVYYRYGRVFGVRRK